ncbi:MAG: aldolase/citrate lyase family protein [Nitrospinaceae bacterium]
MNPEPHVLPLFPERFMEPPFHLLESLRLLKDRFGATCLKLSTEDAGMNHEQIRFWTRLSEGVLPVMVKIGGPNARNDIKQVLSMDVEGLIAPMVESPYGLENFLAAIRNFTTPGQMGRIKIQINIETVTAVEQLDAILASPEAKFLHEITIGCSDLSQSLKKPRMDRAVRALVKRAVKKIKSRNIAVSVGGGIAPNTIDDILEDIQPHQFNTRVVTFGVIPGKSYYAAVEETLRFELKMLNNDLERGFIHREEERSRAQELRKRLVHV